ncbi:hypothetical protein K458DRAFT_22349 [Lentithecium fluviatile CBS 122367]|uniref:Uncharacterized protein n=1 Tax=Lentithecium fluviatile CBS 122367 TaxID=1168545 RepID=A0A6G1J4E8_9PLEO|nr:hypothetical protein K458DRAFT_22349 [Lentithecium fluviatile CBS 122367]
MIAPAFAHAVALLGTATRQYARGADDYARYREVLLVFVSFYERALALLTAMVWCV